MNWQDHIVATADTCAGKPRRKGTHITVELILNCLASGWSEGQIIDAYPYINVKQIRAAVAFASSRVGRDSTLTDFEAAA
jgi:uncharacterized protein (DUF433 family)